MIKPCPKQKRMTTYLKITTLNQTQNIADVQLNNVHTKNKKYKNLTNVNNKK